MTTAPCVRSFAFYHPGFQPTSETDAALGRGWSDWTDVAGARPLYAGHQQPRLPRDLGFYDLRLSESALGQADLARQYGIDGFIYSHYWFKGRRIYNQPVAPDFEFALCWNNEDFCSPEGEVMIAQSYSADDDRAHARFVAQTMQNERCIRIDNKPLFVIQDPAGLPDSLRTTQVLREEARNIGIGEIYLAYCEGAVPTISPEQLGFDAAIENAPMREASPATFYETLETHNYLDMAGTMLARPQPPYRRFSCVTPGYDNSPLLGMNACLFPDSQPALYKGWVASTIQRDLERNLNSETILFVNSWNDWTSGSALEPCSVWGTQYLEAHHLGLNQGVTPALALTAPGEIIPNPPARIPSFDAATDRIGVSLVMVVNGNAGATMRALQSALETCTEVGRLEFVVIDNGSNDETQATLQALHREVFSERNEVEVPAAQAWTQGLRCANGEYVIFMSNDIVMKPNWLEPALLTLATDPQSAAVTARVNAGGQMLNSQPLTMTTGVCLVGRSTMMNGAIPTEARSVETSVVALAVDAPINA